MYAVLPVAAEAEDVAVAHFRSGRADDHADGAARPVLAGIDPHHLLDWAGTRG
jgi:hypothetical protein